LEALVDDLTKGIEDKEREVNRLRGIPHFFSSCTYFHCWSDVADRAESLSQAALEHKQQSRQFTSIRLSAFD
jgi:hypothetical protein